MRIRKNAKKLSPVLFSSVESVPEVLQTHVCQLNQSPWDVIPLHHQHATNQLQDTFNDNASLADSFPAVESVASMEESEKLSSSYIVVSNESEVMAEEDGDYCEDLDENGDGFVKLVDCSWKCKKQFEEEDYSSSTPDHHHHHHHRRRPSLLRSTEINYYSSITKKSAAGGMVSRRTRPARASKKSVSAAAVATGGSDPYEFYYYSGFGPLWGKKRRDRGGEDGGRSSENTRGNRSNGTTPSEIDGDELDYVDDDDEEEEENDGDGDGGKKRMRKPVKARSLKSLM